LERSLSKALGPWRGPRTVHDPAKVLVDVAVAVALGGDCLADIGVVRAQPGLFGQVASDPTVSRLIARLAADVETSLPAIRAARATVFQGPYAAGTSRQVHPDRVRHKIPSISRR